MSRRHAGLLFVLPALRRTVKGGAGAARDLEPPQLCSHQSVYRKTKEEQPLMINANGLFLKHFYWLIFYILILI
jgi:hypothetical protein